MTTIDYDQLRGESGGDPPDGMHSAYLARAALVSTRNGDKLVTEWQTTDPPHYWSTWFGFDGQQMKFTQEFLDSLGVDRPSVTNDDALEAALNECIGTVYTVRTEAGAAWVNTYVEDTVEAAQTDLPIDTADLPPSPPPPGAPTPAGVGVGAQDQLPADDDIPF